MLHGPPGNGNTLTAGRSMHVQFLNLLSEPVAESVAGHTGRPLLCITAAELGDVTTTVESTTIQHLRRENEWDAIVLLDEADGYLERRDHRDL